ncbi:MAG: NERD domain-containing protein [Defluviitaleaceae bacterium]|nr:NERD domain-containing protein [Defluviitaleaceae bacterium]
METAHFIFFGVYFMFFVTVFIVVLIKRLKSDTFKNPDEYKTTGAIGERLIYLELLKHFPEETILRNLYLHKKDGKLTEIDLVLVTKKGIFVFESKNYSGWIFGSEKGKWTETFPNGAKIKFFNPVIQNHIHITSLRHNLIEFSHIPYFSVIVFGDRCALVNVSVNVENVFVIKTRHVMPKINEILSDADEVISDDGQNKIIEMLSPASRPPYNVIRQHLKEIKEQAADCPRCGGSLVERINGNTGEVFYGCRDFPACRYTTNSI